MLHNFVLETANAPGTAATVNLAGAATGRVTFASVFTTGANVFYFMDDGTQAEWGIGGFTSGAPNTLARNNVLGNTAGTTAKLNFLGTTRVYNEVPADNTVYRDINGAATAGAFVPSSATVPTNGMFLPAGNTIGFSVNSVEKIRLLSTGDIWFTGTSSQAVPIVNVAVGMGYSQVTQTLSIYSGTCPLNLAGTFNTQPVTQYFFNQTQVGSVTITSTTTAFNTSSDYRLKVTYGTADTGAEIDAVPVHDAAFRVDLASRRPMFLAHELQAVAPWAVRGDKDAVDENGAIIPQQVDHSALVPALWAEVQSLRARVAALESKP